MNHQNSKRSPVSAPIRKAVRGLRRGDLGRRDFLRRVVVLGGSSSLAFALLGRSEAAAQRHWLMQRGGSGPQSPSSNPPSGFPSNNPSLNGSPTNASTMWQGEQGNTSPIRPQPSTTAYGEEQGPPTVTTYAVGEETTTPPRPPATTFAVGEESRPSPPNCKTPPTYPSPPATTQAWGEESQTLPTPPTYTPPTIDPSKSSTRALGEEGNPPSGTPQSPIRFPSPPKNLQQIPKIWNNFGRW